MKLAGRITDGRSYTSKNLIFPLAMAKFPIIQKTGCFFMDHIPVQFSRNRFSVGVIGTQEGLSYLRKWAISLSGFIPVPPPGKTDKQHRLHLSNFPGLEEAFGLLINPNEFVERRIDLEALDNATKTSNQHEAVRRAVDIYIQEIEHHDKNEEQTVDVWILILPELIFARCRPLSRRSGLDLVEGNFSKKKKTRSYLPLLKDVIDLSDEVIFDDSPDFHRQVKARLLKLGHTSQLIRETTIAPEEFVNSAGYPLRHLQEPASVAWNLATGLYYKTQAEPPWKVGSCQARCLLCWLSF